MNIVKIKETCLYIKDLRKAKTFYHEMLGLPIIHYVDDKHIFFRAGASVLLCFNPDDSKSKSSPPGHYGGGKQHFAFEVKEEEYQTTMKNLETKGIRITEEVTWPSGKKSFYFEDLTGNVLEVVPDRGVWD